jgi:hypothetical protein
MKVRIFPLLRCGRQRSKWTNGTSCSARPETVACRLWAIEKYSTNLISALFRTSAERRSPVVLMFFAVLECAFGYATWLYADDQNANDCHFLSTSCSPSISTRAKHKIVGSTRVRILLGTIRRPRGRQSRNKSERISIIRIDLCTRDNNMNRSEFP